ARNRVGREPMESHWLGGVPWLAQLLSAKESHVRPRLFIGYVPQRKERATMMVQDQYSGYVHEVPDQLLGYGLGEVVYDGFGNAVGWNPFETISKVVSGAGDLVRGAV